MGRRDITPAARVAASMRRLSPTVVTIIAGVLALLLVVYVFAGGRSGSRNADKLSDRQVADTNPSERCGSQQTQDLIKRELFRRAAQARGTDQAAFDRLSADSVVRLGSPTLQRQDPEVQAINCTGLLFLNLPPNFQVVGGRQTLTANVGYSIQPAADGSGDVLTLSRADAIIAPLATLARIGSGTEEPIGASTASGPSTLPDAGTGGETPGQAPAPRPPPAPLVDSRDSAQTAPLRPRPAASPSFNCRRARTRGEIAVCNDADLASLDRQMAAHFNTAMSRATLEQQEVLQRTRSRFLANRDSCRSTSCMADAYRARMNEISGIIARPTQSGPIRPALPAPANTNVAPPPIAAGPSFNCQRARSRGEVAVCKDPGLASLDRQMAVQFNNAMSRGTPEQQALLVQTRARFLYYRDSCRRKSCVAGTYQSRMREISDIMTGRWRP